MIEYAVYGRTVHTSGPTDSANTSVNCDSISRLCIKLTNVTYLVGADGRRQPGRVAWDLFILVRERFDLEFYRRIVGILVHLFKGLFIDLLHNDIESVFPRLGRSVVIERDGCWAVFVQKRHKV